MAPPLPTTTPLPPSSVHGEADEDDRNHNDEYDEDDDDEGEDEDDNWSRQVASESVRGGDSHPPTIRISDFNDTNRNHNHNHSNSNRNDHHHHNSNNNNEDEHVGGAAARMATATEDSGVALTPQQPPELTLKEKLVLRERQRRIETERARLKRQFALSSSSSADAEEGLPRMNQDEIFTTATMNARAATAAVDGAGIGIGGEEHTHNQTTEQEEIEDRGGRPTIHSMEDEETLGGESTRAHQDEEESTEDSKNRKLGFNMERFLRNSDSFHPELETTLEHNIMNGNHRTDGGETSTTSAVAAAAEQPGVVMERFMNEPMVVSDSVHSRTDDVIPRLSSGDNKNNDDDDRMEETHLLMTQQDNEVIMSGVEIEEIVTTTTYVREPHRSVSFDIDGGGAGVINGLPVSSVSTSRNPMVDMMGASTFAVSGSQASFGDDTGAMASNASEVSELYVPPEEGFDDEQPLQNNPLTYSASMEMQVDVTSSHGDALSHASDEPRVLRLTEADMQEMASIDDASIGNAPPSDRDQEEILSEIAELVDFSGHGGDRPMVGDTNVSQDTPTTAVESASQLSGHASQRSAHVGATSVVSATSVDNMDGYRTFSDHQSVSGEIDGMPLASDPSRYLQSPGAVSVTVNPPSERGGDEDVDDESPLRDVDGIIMPNDHDHAVQLYFEERIDQVPELPFGSTTKSGLLHGPLNMMHDDSGLVNRVRHHNANHASHSVDESLDSENVVVEGFDFDKNAPQSPFGRGARFADSLRALPGDPQSPYSDQLCMSPLNSDSTRIFSLGTNDYGALNANSDAFHAVQDQITNSNIPSVSLLSKADEEVPLLSTRSGPKAATQNNFPEKVASMDQRPNPNFLGGSMLATAQAGMGQSEREPNAYHSKGILARGKDQREFHVFSFRRCTHELTLRQIILAFSDRQIALFITVAIEIPLMLMIVGGSDAICQQLGRKRQQLLLGFLPVINAVSGNVGLQASTLTYQYISLPSVTIETYKNWMKREVGASAFLGLGIGAALGLVSYVASGFDVAFSVTMFAAQFMSIVIAGIAGVTTPLAVGYAWKQNSATWQGSIITAVQDIVGGVAVLVMASRILAFQARDVELPVTDRCFD